MSGRALRCPLVHGILRPRQQQLRGVAEARPHPALEVGQHRGAHVRRSGRANPQPARRAGTTLKGAARERLGAQVHKSLHSSHPDTLAVVTAPSPRQPRSAPSNTKAKRSMPAVPKRGLAGLPALSTRRAAAWLARVLSLTFRKESYLAPLGSVSSVEQPEQRAQALKTYECEMKAQPLSASQRASHCAFVDPSATLSRKYLSKATVPLQQCACAWARMNGMPIMK